MDQSSLSNRLRARLAKDGGTYAAFPDLAPLHDKLLAVVEAAERCTSDISLTQLKSEIAMLKINLILNDALAALEEDGK